MKSAAELSNKNVTRTLRRRRAALGLAAFGAFVAGRNQRALATDYTFSSGNGAWGTTTNWSPTLTTAGTTGPTTSDTLNIVIGTTAMTLTATTWSNVGAINFSDPSSRTLNNATGGSVTSFIKLNGVTGSPASPFINVTSTSRFTITGPGTGTLGLILGSSGTFNVNTGGTLSISALIADGGNGYSITKTGGGTLVMGNSTNSFSGGMTVSGGTVSFFNGNQLGAAPAVANASYFVLDGGALAYTSGSSGFTQSTKEGIQLNAGGGTIDVQGSVTYTIGNTLSGVGSLTKVGVGTLALGSSMSYAGGLNLNAGTVSIGSSQFTLGSGSSTTTFNGGILGVTSNLTFSSTRSFVANSSAIIDVQSGNSGTMNAVISGNGGLTKTGPGTLFLNENNISNVSNTFLGNVLVSGGTLGFSGRGDLGDANNTVVINGGALRQTLNGTSIPENTRTFSIGALGGIIDVAGASGNLDIRGTIAGVGSSTAAGVGLLTKTGVGTLILNVNNSGFNGLSILGGDVNFFNGLQLGAVPVNSIANYFTIDGGTLSYSSSSFGYTQSSKEGVQINAGNATFDVQSSSVTYTVGATVSGVGMLNKIGGGTLALASVNSYTGGTSITNGTISVASSTALGDATAVNPVSIAGGALEFTGTVTNVNVNRPITVGAVAATSGSTSVGTIGVAATKSVTLLGNIKDNSAGSLGGIGSLVKTDAGTLTLGGTGSYTGSTTVLNGTFDVTGVLTGTPTITIDSTVATPALILDSAGAIPATTTVTGVGPAAGFVANAGQSFASLTSAGSSSFAGGSSSVGSIGGVGTIVVAGPASLTATAAFATGQLTSAGVVTLPANSSTVTAVDGTGTLVVPVGGSLTSASYINHGLLTNNGVVSVASGTSTISTIGGTGSITVGSAATLNVLGSINHGALVSNGSINVSGGATNVVGTVDGAGTLAITAPSFTATYIRQGGLSVAPGATAVIAHDNQSATGGTPIGTSSVTTLSVDAAGTLDLTNNGIVVTDTTQFGAIQSSLATAYTAGWVSPGITSSTAAAHVSDHGVGYALASAIGSTSFNGITFADAVIARYTLLGDTNLKGGVDLGDYTKVITNLGKTGTVWSDGNFDYSGTVGLGDYTKVILALGRTDATAVNETTLNGTAGPSAKQVRASSSALTLQAAPAVSPAATATDVHLVVNTASGLVTLISAVSGSQAIITAYTVKSPSGSLVKFKNSGSKYLGSAFQNNPGVFYSSSNGNTYNNWTGIKNTSTIIGEGFGNNYIATNDTTWTNYTLSSGGYALGAMFKTLSAGGVQDLSFQWDDKALNTFTSVVDYVGGTVPEPTSVSLIAMGAVGLLGRRRRRSR